MVYIMHLAISEFRIAQCLNRIFVAIQIAIESNRDLISPITGVDAVLMQLDEFKRLQYRLKLLNVHDAFYS